MPSSRGLCTAEDKIVVWRDHVDIIKTSLVTGLLIELTDGEG